MHTTWVADETIPTRDFTEFIGALKGGNIPVKKPMLRGDLPKEFDAAANWPQCPSIKEIRDQSVCGSCWAVGAAAAATDRWCIATEGKVQDRLSSLDILSCCEYCGKGCQGGYPIEAWNSFVDKGVSTGGAYGSQDWCDAYPNAPESARRGTLWSTRRTSTSSRRSSLFLTALMPLRLN